MSPRSLLASLALASAPLVIGCATEDPPKDDLASTEQALSTPVYEMPQNGYAPDGIVPNYPLLWTVWQHPLDDAGVSVTLGTTVSAYGISTAISSLFNTGNPRTSAEYLMSEIVSCALDSGRHVTATVGTTTFHWDGKFGLCDTGSPFGNWWNSGVSLSCRYIVSACILARMNARGKHVPISIRVPDEIGTHPVDASKFHPVNRVRVQTMLRDGTTVAGGWQPDFVGVCTRGTTVTLQRATAGQAVRVCTGIHACNLGQQEPIVPGSPRIYSGFLAAFGTGDAISFTCPRNAATAPNGYPQRAYFSVMVSPGTGGAISPDPWLVPIASGTTTYPAPERDVFTYPEGGFYGDVLPNLGVGVETSSCYGPLWRDGRMYEDDRICTDPHAGCFESTGPCQRDCTGRSSTPDEAYYDCLSDVDVPRWTGVTVFLNEPSAISSNLVASAIESVHDVCTSGAPLVNDGTRSVVTTICGPDQDPYCCSAAWDSRCIDEVRTVANSWECSAAPCSHPVCTTGTALTNGCSPVVAKVCNADEDPYCCSVAWDDICVQEVQTVANSPACACSHPVCTTGAELNNGCSPVVTSVCAVDSFCCRTAWDSTCVQEVQTVANSPACACSHPVCTTGAALTDGCSPVATSVCAADPYCCATAWDGICVQEVRTVANSQACN